MKTHHLQLVVDDTVCAERGLASPPAPASTIRLPDTRAADREACVRDEDAMYHPSCEAVSCQLCPAYLERMCALLYFVPARVGR